MFFIVRRPAPIMGTGTLPPASPRAGSRSPGVVPLVVFCPICVGFNLLKTSASFGLVIAEIPLICQLSMQNSGCHVRDARSWIVLEFSRFCLSIRMRISPQLSRGSTLLIYVKNHHASRVPIWIKNCQTYTQQYVDSHQPYRAAPYSPGAAEDLFRAPHIVRTLSCPEDRLSGPALENP